MIPDVSVIIPTFNRAKELPKSIASVLSQTFKSLELIIIDDASTDNTQEVVEAFGDERLRYYRLRSNVGGAEARNVGIRLARGAFVAFQDSDDEWTCLKLEKSLRELDSDPSLGAVFSAYIQVWDSGCRKMPSWTGAQQPRNLYEDLLWRNLVGTPTLVVRKSVIEKINGFDATMPRYQDWELALRLASATKIGYLDTALILSYVTKGGISYNQQAHAIALQKIYEKHAENISGSKSLKSVWLHRLGDAKFMVNETGGRRLLLEAWLKYPFNLRYMGKMLLSLPNSAKLYRSLITYLKDVMFWNQRKRDTND